jgi:6 kDa early secretory antigenic target
MDNGLLLVNFGSLSQASADIDKALGELQSQLGQLKQDAAPLVETWDGLAQAAYRERQNKWETAANDLSEILRQIKIAVEESASDYQDTERRATNRFQ